MKFTNQLNGSILYSESYQSHLNIATNQHLAIVPDGDLYHGIGRDNVRHDVSLINRKSVLL
ncbi:hypothetical protein [Marinomonas spartinae]|uniref:hypothetical protein n=1 Tax=Marinomonas spartinae TaxID=1792290 RepID=UPI0018F274B3|nr:hypothetical protein [Marinomonas spartinae]MBJ7554620.1 hypothetical protein [Marinomonas spartinae]